MFRILKKCPFIITIFLFVFLFFCYKRNDSVNIDNLILDDNIISKIKFITEQDIKVDKIYENYEDNENVILIDNKNTNYKNIKVIKSAYNDIKDNDFYGVNSAILVTNDSNLTISKMILESSGKYANGILCYDKKSSVKIDNSILNIYSDNSSALISDGGYVDIKQSGIAIFSDSSCGIKTDNGGSLLIKDSYVLTEGKDSPCVYSKGNTDIDNSCIQSNGSQVIVLHNDSSISLKNSYLIVNNILSDNDSLYKQAVKIFSSNVNSDAGKSYFSMENTTLDNKNSDIFFVSNVICDIDLKENDIINHDENGNFMRVCGIDNDLANGGKVNLVLNHQAIDGDVIVDKNSCLNMYLTNSSVYSGAINQAMEYGNVYVDIKSNSQWILSDNSYVTSLNCARDSINLNGYHLYVNGVEYKEGTISFADRIEFN